MAAKESNNDLKENLMKENLVKEAWRSLSLSFPWNEQLLEKHKNEVSWILVCINENVSWTPSMLEKFKNQIDWDELSDINRNHESYDAIINAEMLEKYKAYWNWAKLSSNLRRKMFKKIFEKFLDHWDWAVIIDNSYLGKVLNADFFSKYQKYIPTSELQDSRLWKNLIEAETESMMKDIIAQ